MKPSNRYLVEEFPDSPYAVQLKRGITVWGFRRELELPYAEEHFARVQFRVRLWLTLSFSVGILKGLGQAHGTATYWVQLIGLTPCEAALVLLAWLPGYTRRYPPFARFLVPLSCALMGVLVGLVPSTDADGLFAALTIHVVAGILFSGLLFRPALCCAAVAPIAYTVTKLVMTPAAPVFTEKLLILALTAGVAIALYRDIELTNRRAFLEDALIEVMALRDRLTGLLNRRAFDEQLLRVWQQGQRDRRSLAILLIDIDHFKSFNDAFGHPAGDDALRHVAHVLKSFARRPLDMAARYGGEEFAIVLYDLADAHIADIAERVRREVEEISVANRQVRRRVTVSVGVAAVIPGVGRTPLGAIQLADDALYEAKELGRNCVVSKGIDSYALLKTGSFKQPA